MDYDFNAVVQVIQELCEQRSWDALHGPKDLAIALAAEAGDLLHLFRFHTDQQSLRLLKRVEAREQVAKELAEALFVILRFSQMYSVNLQKALEEKIDQIRVEYPVELAG